MFTHVGWNRWKNEESFWTSEELAALYYCLWNTLDHTEDVNIRHDIVFLMEKLFQESDTHDPIKEIGYDGSKH